MFDNHLLYHPSLLLQYCNTGLEDLYCGPHEFTCVQAHRCIPKQKRCDRNNDCNDWEDEIGCGKHIHYYNIK